MKSTIVLYKNTIVQKHGSTAAGTRGLASSDQARRVTDWRRERSGGDGGAEGPAAMGDGGQAACSLTPDVMVPC